MRRKLLLGLLIAEGVGCAALCLARVSFAAVFPAVAAFPFAQIGLGLRTLSLSGAVGNAAAIALYCVVCLLPVAALGLARRRGLQWEDGLLLLLSAALFAALYLMVNPGLIGALAGGAAMQAVGKAALGSMVYAVLCGYAVLRAMRRFSSGGTARLARNLLVLLGVIAALFVALACAAHLGELLDSIAALRVGNVGNEHLLGASYVCLAARYLASALPALFATAVVFAALRLLDELRVDRYAEGTVAAAERLARVCGAALTATVLCGVAVNLLQLLLIRSLLTVSGTVQLPVFEVAFALAALLLARFITEGKALKDDNDLFI